MYNVQLNTCTCTLNVPILDLQLEMEVEALKEKQDMILVRLAAIEDFLKDSQQQQMKGHLPPS